VPSWDCPTIRISPGISCSRDELITALYRSIGEECATDPGAAHIEIHANRILGIHLVPGLEVDAEALSDGIRAAITLRKNVKINPPVRICFGLLDPSGIQKIDLRITLEEGSRVAILSSCTFPNAVDVLHAMDADIRIEKGAEYLYLERHVHGPEGGVTVIPKAKIRLGEAARFHSDFELVIEGLLRPQKEP
jgi:hypothetical protein